MTTAASFPSLQAPLAEDSMEMSSPAQPSYDDDIDIDFEEHVGGVELTDDERMADDMEQPRPGTATDDMMEDDDARAIRLGRGVGRHTVRTRRQGREHVCRGRSR